MTGRYPGTCLVLLVEDSSLVALDLEGDLVDAGYTVAGPFSSCAEAMSWVSSQTPDMAVLDITLKDGPCTELAAELTQRDVPFVVFSARSRSRNTIPEFKDAPWVEKPGSGKLVIAALAEIQMGQMRREG